MLITLTHGCLKVHGGVPIILCILVDPLQARISCLVFREWIIAIFLNPDSWSSSHNSWFKYQQTKKEYNTKATHITAIVFFKQRQEDMLCLVCKKLYLCPVMPASRGVNPLATSHTVEHLSRISLHIWRHDKPILNLIYHFLNKIDIAWNLWQQSKNFLILQKKVINLDLYLGDVTLQNVN